MDNKLHFKSVTFSDYSSPDKSITIRKKYLCCFTPDVCRGGRSSKVPRWCVEYEVSFEEFITVKVACILSRVSVYSIHVCYCRAGKSGQMVWMFVSACKKEAKHYCQITHSCRINKQSNTLRNQTAHLFPIKLTRKIKDLCKEKPQKLTEGRQLLLSYYCDLLWLEEKMASR